jgi:outer membrane protein assembly factor BamB
MSHMPSLTDTPPAKIRAALPAPLAPPLRTRAANRIAVASGAFCIVLALALALGHFRHKHATHPLDHPKVIELKEQLIREPANEPLKQEIRALDLQLRLAHDRYLTRLRRAPWLLLGGMAVFLAAVQTATWRNKIARPGKRQNPPGWQAREIVQSSAAVALLGLGAGAFSWWLAQSSRTLLTSPLAGPAALPAPTNSIAAITPRPAAPFPNPEEVAHNWGRFRGPGGAGVSAYTNVPLTWDVKTGEGVLWKTQAPGPDFNSPVVWGDRLFLTSATARKREVFCYDATNGKLLWQKAVDKVPNGGAAVEMNDASGGFAGPTAATDGRRVYAMFANGDLAAFDCNGNLAWARSFAPINNQYGHAASLELWQDRLIIQLDHGDSDQKVSRLIAVNTATGQTAWEKPRETHGTWSTPVAIEAAGKAQIITLGLPHVISYAATDGAGLWRVEGIDGEITPSPIFAGGLVLAPSPSAKLFAIKPDGAGEVTKTHVAWITEDGVPDITSPVSDGQRVYLLTTGGTLTACDLKTGKKVWEKDLETEFKASPAVAGDRLYLVGSKGVVVVLAAGPEFKELARTDLADQVVASPAFADGRLFLRTRQSILCLGHKPD